MIIFGIHLSNLVIWLLFGAIVGAFIHLIDNGHIKGGIFTTMLLGMLGALFGGFISTSFLDKGFITLTTAGLAVAVLASIIMAIIARLVFRTKNKDHIKTIKTQLI